MSTNTTSSKEDAMAVEMVRAQKMHAAAPASEPEPQRRPRQMCGG
jgi:hypothetical protein